MLAHIHYDGAVLQRRFFCQKRDLIFQELVQLLRVLERTFGEPKARGIVPSERPRRVLERPRAQKPPLGGANAAQMIAWLRDKRRPQAIFRPKAPRPGFRQRLLQPCLIDYAPLRRKGRRSVGGFRRRIRRRELGERLRERRRRQENSCQRKRDPTGLSLWLLHGFFDPFRRGNFKTPLPRRPRVRPRGLTQPAERSTSERKYCSRTPPSAQGGK